jgi:hypothetical protein
VQWKIEFGDDFDKEFAELREDIQDELLAHSQLMSQFGPTLGRPQVDTLKGSQFSNMKELRFYVCDGEWRVAFAFDPQRTGILLVAGCKNGVNKKRFYDQLLDKADSRYAGHLKRIRM